MLVIEPNPASSPEAIDIRSDRSLPRCCMKTKTSRSSSNHDNLTLQAEDIVKVLKDDIVLSHFCDSFCNISRQWIQRAIGYMGILKLGKYSLFE